MEVFNRFLKHGAQTFNTDKTWKQNIYNLLEAFRFTAASSEGKSPAELLHGWKPRAAHEIPLSTHTADQQKQEVAEKPHVLRQICHPRELAVGDLVCTKLHQVPKGYSPWSKPMKIEEVLGNWSYKLSDGQKWNARKLKKYFLPITQPWIEIDKSECVQRPELRRSQRINKGIPPLRFSP